MIEKVANMKINVVVNDLNQTNASYVKVQFLDDPAGKNHQNVLSSHMISIRHEEIPVLDPLIETCIATNNQPVLTISAGVV